VFFFTSISIAISVLSQIEHRHLLIISCITRIMVNKILLKMVKKLVYTSI